MCCNLTQFSGTLLKSFGKLQALVTNPFEDATLLQKTVRCHLEVAFKSGQV